MNMNAPPQSIDELPASIPVFPLLGALLLPDAQLPLNIFEPRYIAMIDHAFKSDRVIGMIQPAEKDAAMHDRPDLREVGCAGRITQFSETGDGRYLITLTGIARYRISSELPAATPYRQCQVNFSEYSNDLVQNDGGAIDREQIVKVLKQYTKTRNMRIDWTDIDKATNALLVNAMSMMGPFEPNEKQALLEAPDIESRCNTLIAIIEMELANSGNVSTKLQ